jgi:hypothetical protein
MSLPVNYIIYLFGCVALFPAGGNSFNFLFFHAPAPMSHAKVLHAVTREIDAEREKKILKN